MNKQQMIKNLIFTSLILAAFLLWGNGIYKLQYVRENYDSYGVRVKTDGITNQMLSNALEAEQSSGAQQLPVVCAWNFVCDQRIENDFFETDAKANVYEIFGEMKLASANQLMRGYFPDTENDEGCVISNTLAYDLFHSDNVIENRVTYQNKTYIICGIVEDRNATIFIRSRDEKKTYQNIEFLYEDAENAKQQVTNFLTKNAWTDSCVVLNRDIYIYVLELLGKLPVWMIAISLSTTILWEVWKRRRIATQLVVLLIGLLLMLVIFRWGCNLYVSIPEELIPTKWSDFNFWVMKFKELNENIQAAAYIRPVPKDVLFKQLYIEGIHYDLFGTIVIMIGLGYEKYVLKVKNLIAVSIYLCILESFAIAILFLRGIMFKPDQGYLFILPLYFIFHYIKRMISTIADGKEDGLTADKK